MISVTSIDTIFSSITYVKNQKKGFLTNFFLDIPKSELWIKLKLVYYEIIGETVIIIRTNIGFNNFFYITTDIQALGRDSEKFFQSYPNDIYVVDIVGLERDIEKIKPAFEAIKFYKYTSLVRMSRILDESSKKSESNFIDYSNRQMSQNVHDMLQKFFDPYAEQLPLIEEIEEWSDKRRILVYCNNSIKIQGFLIFDLIGKTSYLRYWFVHPDNRDMKIGSALLNRFFYESQATTRQLFWVIKSNDNAIKRYEHYGFKKEELNDYILINKNVCYEG